MTARSADNAGLGSVERRSDAMCDPLTCHDSGAVGPRPADQSVAQISHLTQKNILDCKGVSEPVARHEIGSEHGSSITGSFRP